MLARRIVVLIEAHRIDVSTEDSAHRSLAGVLKAARIACEDEVSIGNGDRIDLIAGRVGIEIKAVASRHSRRAILRQLERYAASDRIDALVLATGAVWSRAGMQKVGGKPLFVASLSRGWL